VVAEQPPVGADRERSQRPDRVAARGEQQEALAAYEECRPEQQTGRGVDEEEDAHHVHPVEVVEVEVEMERARRGNEKRGGQRPARKPAPVLREALRRVDRSTYWAIVCL
jgi:hypothetical protein